MIGNIEHWFCCLHPVENNSVNIILANPFFLAGFMPKALFDAVWLSRGFPVDGHRYNTFLNMYHLEPGELVIGEDAAIEGFYLDMTLWMEIQEFSLTEDAGCPLGCYFTRPPFS